MKAWKKGDWMMGCGGGHQAGGAVYGLGFLGALIYFLQHAATLGDGFMGVIKAVVWPGVLIYRVLELLKM